MNDPQERQTLADVLDAFIASGAGPESPLLAEWIRRYPQYTHELTEFAASWSLMRSLPPALDADEVDEETLVLRGMSVVQNLLHKQPQTQTSTSALLPFESLVAEARSRGLVPREFARAAGIGDGLLRKLDRRLIRYASIPHEAIEVLAAVIQRQTESVARYLQQGPTFAAAAQHHAERAPELAEPEDFFVAVRSDPTMTDEQRARWLAFAHREGR
ncbi:MAG: hypothetical protein KJ048_00100 [Dehalococcoidia bacterium]|nr:hypothetical protein [Dehalococcoidia bacterium]